ncbi:MAG TPA: DinB family protein [Candidatus Limnocylindrales bacterium]|nr:DinB family protein [Candidatus Limnocylindrales bacterium]
MSLTAFYGHWRIYNRLFAAAIRGMDPAELQLQADVADPSTAAHWPIWAIAAHTAGARVYWLCVRAGEPGLERAAFVDARTGEGWEDDLSKPRSADEVADALQLSWSVIDGAIDRWTPEMLAEPIAVESSQGLVHHTRESILIRLLMHDAYHVGEIALIQGIHGRAQLDLWPAGVHTVEAAEAR